MANPGTNPSDPLSGADTTQTRGAAEAARAEAEHLSDRAREKAGQFKRQAEDTAHGMRQRARSAVDHQKDAAVGRIEGVAHALRSASDDLRGRGQPMVAEYSSQVAEGLESMADSLSRRNVDDLVGGVEDFARERPVAFIGGAMVAGFALARFMKSSSARRSRPSAAEHGGASAARAGSPSPGTPTRPAGTPTPASAGTPAAGGYGRPTEGGV